MRAALACLLTPSLALAAPVPPIAEAPDLEPAADVVRVALTAAPTGDDVFPYAYNGQRIGPTLRVRAGDMFVAELDNALDAPTTIHWHGVEVPYAMDGTTWQFDPVGPGERFTYQFAPPQPGTYWYHPHFDTARQVDGGLMGVLVVEDPAAPAPDDDLILVFDRPMEGHESPRTPEGHGVLDAHWIVNGAAAPVEYTARGGTVVQVRLLNASSTGYLDLRWPGLRHIAGDQGWLPAAQTPDRLLLGPGDRAEVEWLVGEEGFTVEARPYSLNGGTTWQDPIALVTVAVEDPAPAPAPLDWPYTGAEVVADPPYSDLTYALTGSDRTGVWHINGERFPAVTVEQVPLGSRPVIEVRNLSPTHHPFHIHGNAFDVLSLDGVPPPYAMVEDTVDVPIHGRLRVRLRADNPGAWMTHCHILPHAEEGMMTVLQVGE